MSPADRTAEGAARDAWVTRVLGVGVTQETERDEDVPVQRPNPGRTRAHLGAPPPSGLAAWKAAREAAIATLKDLEAAYRGFDHPQSDEGILILRAIRANLTVAPVTPREVDELESYITSDDIFLEAEEPNGFGITVELRRPLLAAVDSLRKSMTSRGGTR